MLAHNVYFKLKDRTDSARAALVSACKEHLTGHPGTVFFAAGTLATELDRPVNDRDWDVALHLVFRTPEDQDSYQVAPRHHRFVEENRDSWDVVRVFDSIVDGV
ncbi:MAG: Dabb family protein [Isosphaeraceae bacterium]